MFCIRILDIQSASFSFSEPWDYVALRLAQSHQAEPQSGEATPSEKIGSTIWWDILNFGRTYFERN